MEKDVLLDRVAGCLLGMAVGDAMGMPAIGMTPYEVMLYFQSIDGFYGTRVESPNGKPGFYTGVTELGIVSAGSIIRKGGVIDAADMASAHLEFSKHKPARWNQATTNVMFNESGEMATCRDAEFLGKMMVVGLLAAAKGWHDQELASECKKVANFTTTHKPTVLAGFSLAKVTSQIVKNKKSLGGPLELYDMDTSLLASIVGTCSRAELGFGDEDRDKLSGRLMFARRSLQSKKSIELFAAANGTAATANLAVPLALFSFMYSPDCFDQVGVVAGLGGASSINAALVGGLVGAYSGAGVIPAGLRDQVENSGKIMGISEKFAAALSSKEEKPEEAVL